MAIPGVGMGLMVPQLGNVVQSSVDASVTGCRKEGNDYILTIDGAHGRGACRGA